MARKGQPNPSKQRKGQKVVIDLTKFHVSLIILFVPISVINLNCGVLF